MVPSPAEAAGSAKSVNAFGLALYDKLAARPGNLFFSPYSVAAAVSIVQAGAAGVTAAELAKALHSPADPHGEMRALAASLKEAEPDVTLTVANALWGQEGLPFGKDFLATVKRDYGGGFNTADFAKDASKETARINDWVKERTRQRIKDLLPPGTLKKDARLVLTNAVYFKGRWQEPFDEAGTAPRPFHGAGGTATAPMMQRTGSYGYYADAGLQALELPYAGERVSMLILLPAKRDGLAALEKALPAAFERAAKGLTPRSVSVILPRFKLEDRFKLNEALIALGMASAFDPDRADFKPMCPACPPDSPLYIGEAVHKAFVEVDEAGTEAAAATAVVMMPGATMLRESPPVFLADHPFFFAVRDRATGLILFAGRLARP